jgi:hypothetical protein
LFIPTVFLMESNSKQKNFNFFPSGLDAIFFSYLIVIASTASSMLNRSNKTGCPCFVLYLRGNDFSFFPTSIMMFLVVFLLC